MLAKSLALKTCERFDSQLTQIKQSIELLPAEGGFFAGTLNLDEFTPARHDQIEIYLGVFIFLVIQIKDLVASHKADANCCNAVGCEVPRYPIRFRFAIKASIKAT